MKKITSKMAHTPWHVQVNIFLANCLVYLWWLMRANQMSARGAWKIIGTQVFVSDHWDPEGY